MAKTIRRRSKYYIPVSCAICSAMCSLTQGNRMAAKIQLELVCTICPRSTIADPRFSGDLVAGVSVSLFAYLTIC